MSKSDDAIVTRWRGLLKIRKALLRAALKRRDAKAIKLRRSQVAQAERVVERHSGVDPVALRLVVPNLTAHEAETIADGLTDAFRRFGITTKLRAAAAVAQMAHESAGFRTSTEFASGAEYEGRTDLGNTHPGDGRRFKGRARIQITGRANYLAVSKALGVDFITHPERLSRSPHSEVASAWWWKAHGCNELADGGWRSFTALTRRINGGTNGLVSRVAYYRRARKVADRLTP